MRPLNDTPTLFWPGPGGLDLTIARDSTEERGAQAALREAQANHQALAESLPLVSYVAPLFSSAGPFHYVSPQVEQMLGYEPERFLGDPEFFIGLVHPEDRERLREAAELADRTGQKFRAEYRVHTADSRTLWILDEAVVRQDGSGPPYTDGFMLDITERKQSEFRQQARQAITEALAQASSIFDVTPTLLEAFCTTLGWDVAQVWALDRAGHSMRLLGTWRGSRVGAELEATSRDLTFAPGQGIVGSVWDHGEPIWIEDLAEQHDAARIDAFRADGLRTMVAAPFEVGGSLVAVAECFSSELRPLDEQFLALVREFENQVSEFVRRRGVEKKLARAETRYRNLVERLPVASYIRSLDLHSPNLYCSPQVEGLLGYTAEEWETDPGMLEKAVHPDDRERVEAECLRLRESGDALHLEYRCITRDGRIVWVQDEAHLVENERGEPQVEGFLLDITQRKEAEVRAHVRHAVTAALATASSAQEAAPRLLAAFAENLGWDLGQGWVVDRERPMLRLLHSWRRSGLGTATAAASGLMEVSPGEGILGRVWAKGEPEWIEDVSSIPDFVRGGAAGADGLRTMLVFPIELGDEIVSVAEFFSRDGKQVDAPTLELLRDLRSQISEFLERRRAEARLARTERRYRTLSENLPVVTYMASLDGHQPSVYVSPQVEQLTGYTAEEWIGDPEISPRVIHPDDRERVLAAWRSAGASGNRLSLEYRIVTKEGRARWIHNESIPVGEGEAGYAVGFALDITGRKEGEARQAAQAAVAQALAESSSLDEAAPRILEALCLALDLQFGAIWRVDASAGVLRAVDLFASPDLVGSGFYQDLRARGFACGEGPAGRAWESRQVEWCRLADRDRDLPYGPAAEDGRLGSVLCLPVNAANSPQAVVELGFRADEADPSLTNMLTALASQIGVFVERLETEERLREREASLAEAQRIAHIGSWTWDVVTDRVDWSAELMRIFGLEDGEFEGTYDAYLRRVHPEDKERVDGIIREAFETHEPFAYDCRIVRPNGEARTIHAEGEVAVGGDGTPTRMAGVAHDITEQVEAERELLRANERYRSLVERIPLVTYVDLLDEYSTNIYSSPQIKEMLGYTAEEWMSDSDLFREILHPEDRDRVLAAFAYEEGDKDELEYRVFARDGRLVWLRDEFVVVKGEDGELRVEGFLLDVTGRKRAEEQLRESEARFRTMFQSAPTGVVLVDPERRILVANPAFHDLLGYEDGELVGASFVELTYEEDEAASREIIPGLSAGQTIAFEKRYVRKDGSVVWASVTAAPVRNESGELRYAIGIIEDVTARRRAEQELLEGTERYAALIETARDAFVSIDEQSVIVDWNRQAERIFGWPREEAIGRKMPDLIMPPEHRQAHMNGLQRFLETGEAVLMDSPLELTARRRDGSAFPLELTVWPTRTGDTYHFNAFARDLTEQRALEEQLQQAQKMEAIGRLAGGVAHDFNNLLLAIRGYSELALGDLDGENAEAKRSIERIGEAADRAAALTASLLAFGRRQVLQPRPTDLNHLVSNLEDMIKPFLGERIELATRLGPGLGRVEVDPVRMEQAILNLTINARDAMNGSGRLTIETAAVEHRGRVRDGLPLAPGRYVMLTVTDTGSGMDEETKGRIFDPFFTTKEEGSGLGLSTVYGFVEQSEGSIAVQSELGKGTIFLLYFPEVDAVAEPLTEMRPDAEEGEGAETILLVEDEDLVRTLLSGALRKAGYRVLEACDGEDALKVAAAHERQIDVLVTDVVMPNLGGVETAERLAETHPEARTIFMSGYAHDAGELAHPREGRLFLQKPFAASALTACLRELLDAKAVPASR
jgi:PAS domain S-box-containing protein